MCQGLGSPVSPPGFEMAPGAYRQELETTLPRPPKANESRVGITSKMLLHRPTDRPNSDSFFWAVYWFSL